MGISNTSEVLMITMNKLVRDLLHKEVVVFLDDILIYSITKSKHLNLLREVFASLREVFASL